MESEHPALDGWKLVARQRNTGEQVVVCPDHFEELKQADLSYLLKLASGEHRVPVMYDRSEPNEVTSRKPLLK